MRRYTWRDGLFDVTWSEVNEAILVAAAGDGSVLIFDQNLADAPVMVLPGHTAEVKVYTESTMLVDIKYVTSYEKRNHLGLFAFVVYSMLYVPCNVL